MYIMLMNLSLEVIKDLARAKRQSSNPEYVEALEGVLEAIWRLKTFY